MAIGTTTALVLGGAALAGAVSGAIPKTSTTKQEREILPESEFGKSLQAQLPGQFASMGQDVTTFNQRLLDSSSYAPDVAAGRSATLGLADLLQQYSQTGGLPEQRDITTSQELAKNLFQARQVSLEQSFQDQLTEANRRAALMGRSLNDPILAAKLAQEQTRQNQLLQAEQGSTAQQLALALPGQRLGFTAQRAETLTGLGQQGVQMNQLQLANQAQALQNRQALLGMGSNLLGQERNFRIGAGSSNQSTTSGGGFGDILSGTLGGAGFGLSAASMFGGFGGGNDGGGGYGSGGGGGAGVSQFSGLNFGQTPQKFFGVGNGEF